MYVFNQKYWGQGYAKESCRALIERAFQDGTHRIFAECDPRNTNSWKLLEALDFHREARFKQNVYFWTDDSGEPIWKDTYVYSLLKE
ncbi:MAG: GNAT family protein [Eubacteriales bacterium]|nr:GNAT family protein [Eubacteriales bacterium]